MKYDITVSKSWFQEETSLSDGSEPSTFHTTTTIESAKEAALENARRISVRHNIRGKLERLYRWGHKSIRVPKRKAVYKVPCPGRKSPGNTEGSRHPDGHYGIRSDNESTTEEERLDRSREGEGMEPLDMPNMPRELNHRRNTESLPEIDEKPGLPDAVDGPFFQKVVARFRFRMRRKLEASYEMPVSKAMLKMKDTTDPMEELVRLKALTRRSATTNTPDDSISGFAHAFTIASNVSTRGSVPASMSASDKFKNGPLPCTLPEWDAIWQRIRRKFILPRLVVERDNKLVAEENERIRALAEARQRMIPDTHSETERTCNQEQLSTATEERSFDSTESDVRQSETSSACMPESASDDSEPNDDICWDYGVNRLVDAQHVRYEYQVSIGAISDLRGGSASEAASATSSPTSESSLDLHEYNEELSALSYVDTVDPNVEILGPLGPELPDDPFAHPWTATRRDSGREVPYTNAVPVISQTARRFTAPISEALRPTRIGTLLTSNSRTRVSTLHAFAQPARHILARSTSSPSVQALRSVIVARRPGLTPLRPYPLDHGPFVRQIDEITRQNFHNSMVRDVLENANTQPVITATIRGLLMHPILARTDLGNPEINYGEPVTEMCRIVDGRCLWTGDRISLQPWQYIPGRDILYPTGQTLSRFLEAYIEPERDSEHGSVKGEPGYRLQKPPGYEFISMELNAAGSTNDVRSESNRESYQSCGYSGFFTKDGASYWVTNGTVFAPPTYVDRRPVERNWRVGLYDFFRGRRLRGRACQLPPPYVYDVNLDPNCATGPSTQRSSIDVDRTSMDVDILDVDAAAMGSSSTSGSSVKQSSIDTDRTSSVMPGPGERRGALVQLILDRIQQRNLRERGTEY